MIFPQISFQGLRVQGLLEINEKQRPQGDSGPRRRHTVRPYRGTSPLRNRPPPWDPPRTLRLGLR